MLFATSRRLPWAPYAGSESPPARQGATVVPSDHLVKPTKWSCEHTSDSNNSGKRKGNKQASCATCPRPTRYTREGLETEGEDLWPIEGHQDHVFELCSSYHLRQLPCQPTQPND